MNAPIRVAVTGAAGQIGYSLLFRIASGAMFGPAQPVILHLIEIEPALKVLNGVVMELDDCAFPLLQGVVATSDLDEGFRGVNWALLVGSVPRKAGMERKDLLGINGRIFTGQGQAIQRSASSDIRTLVVGNPCNTNCLIAKTAAKEIPSNRWFAMTMLDQNRAVTQLARKAGVRPATEVIDDAVWFQEAFIPTVQKRGASIIEARGLSSAASAANAVVDTVRALTTPTHPDDCFSVAVDSDGSYGIEKGLQFSFPIRSNGTTWEIIQGVPVGEFSRSRITATENELKEEKALVADLLQA